MRGISTAALGMALDSPNARKVRRVVGTQGRQGQSLFPGRLCMLQAQEAQQLGESRTPAANIKPPGLRFCHPLPACTPSQASPPRAMR